MSCRGGLFQGAGADEAGLFELVKPQDASPPSGHGSSLSIPRQGLRALICPGARRPIRAAHVQGRCRSRRGEGGCPGPDPGGGRLPR